MPKKASDIMTPSPVCITAATSAAEAADLMETHDVGSLPVVESQSSNRLVGIVTDRDLALRVLGRGISGNLPVADVMSNNPWSVGPDDPLIDVENLMAEHQVRRVPVLDPRGVILGVIAQADLARERARGDEDFARVIEKISEPS